MLSCDHTSVGLLVWRSNRLLLIERKRPPYGYAPPAGHVDEHGSFEAAAAAELREEVGLWNEQLTLVKEGRKENKCRRPNGSWHYWKIYESKAAGDLNPSQAETKSILWADHRTLSQLADRARCYLDGTVTEAEWEARPGLEPVWYEWLSEIGVLRHTA